MNVGQSLLRQLLAWTLGSLFAVWAAFMYFGYETGVHEADELTDGHLASVASVLFTQHASESRASTGAPPVGGSQVLKAHDYQQSLSIVVWDADGKVLSRSGGAPLPPFHQGEGFETLTLGDPPGTWRVFSRWNRTGQASKVTVMLSVEERDGLAQDIAEQVATPGLWLLPSVALVLIFAVRRGLRPLWDLSEQVHALDIHRDTKLKAPPHEEFKGIVNSIDMLIGRYNVALIRERELASEVAHELRTPLASLRLHADALRHKLDAHEFEATLTQIAEDVERASAVLADLLALARASRAELAEALESVNLADLARKVSAEYGQAALDSGHDLSVEAPDNCKFKGHPVIIALALRNLIENALAHTAAGTSIRVRIHDKPATLEVTDNGAVARRSGHSDASTKRSLGLGLGHQVVRRVADIHGGHFETVDTAVGERIYRVVFGPSMN